jgi:excisionase family DNA binding protein
MSEVLTVSEAARALDVAAQTIREWVDRGKLPAMRTSGGQRIIHRADVERVQRERRAADGDEAA